MEQPGHLEFNIIPNGSLLIQSAHQHCRNARPNLLTLHSLMLTLLVIGTTIH